MNSTANVQINPYRWEQSLLITEDAVCIPPEPEQGKTAVNSAKTVSLTDALRVYPYATDCAMAFNAADSFFDFAESEEYRFLSAAEVKNLLLSAFVCMDNAGLLNLCPSFFENECSTYAATEGIIYKPSYTAIALGIYLLKNHPDVLDPHEKRKLSRLCSAAFLSGIYTYGLSRLKKQRALMWMLVRAGIIDIIEKDPDFSPAMTETVNDFFSGLKGIACEAYPSGKLFLDTAYDHVPVNAKLLQLLSAAEGKGKAIFLCDSLDKDLAASAGTLCGTFMADNFAMSKKFNRIHLSIKQGESAVGKVYFVSEDTLLDLNRYMGRDGAERAMIHVSSAFGELEAVTWICGNQPEGVEQISLPDDSDDSPVWYAAYGLTMDEERLMGYLPSDGPDLLVSDEIIRISGAVHFCGNSSLYGGGLLCYDPDGKGLVPARLYRMTQSDFEHIRQLIANDNGIYDHCICLGIYGDGFPIYTITSKTSPENKPSGGYMDQLAEALTFTKMDPDSLKSYLNCAMR